MKVLSALLIASFCPACAVLHKTPAQKKHTVAHERGHTDSRRKKARVRTEELVKAYPVGRYTDPNDPDTMHERHTLYRREESANWNYLPDQPEALPLGPVVAESNPSSSYYVKTDAELMNAQQKAQADALAEQNRALQKRIADLQQKDSGNQSEIAQLKKQLASIPKPAPATPTATPPSSSSRPWEDFTDKPQ